MRSQIALCLTLLSSPVTAAPLLNPMFSDHAVLQRGEPVHIYGQAPGGTNVTISLHGVTRQAVAGADGQWSADLPAMPAGGPYELNVSGGQQSEHVADILVGDVFLCAGQSNMELPLRQAGNATFEIAQARDGQVREMYLPHMAGPTPLAVFPSPVAWKVEAPETAGTFSASCFFFARELRKRDPNVPIGLVTASWGGTRARGWVSEASLRKQGDMNGDLDMIALYRRDPAAASRQWDAAWEKDWHASSKTSPWREDTSSWPLAPAALGAWNTWPGLSIPEGLGEPGVGFAGQVWLSTHVRLTAEQARQAATIELGRVNEEEKSWVNGQGIGGSSQEPNAIHHLPAGLLHAGDNVVTLNVFCSWRNCGLTGSNAARLIRLGDGTLIPLDQPWRYKTAGDWIAPQLPWGVMHGVSLQYNGMIAPIGPYQFKAAIWYQGESNIYFWTAYQARLSAMIADWRQQFGAKLPFVIVQIPNYGPAYTKPSESGWSNIREAQRRITEADANSALAVTIDIGDAKLLHPLNKQEVGRRIALAVRHLAYGDTVATGPRAAAARRMNGTVVVSFKDVSGALQATSGEPNAFELCDGAVCHWAAASLTERAVTLAGSVAATKVRYCWGDSPKCTLSDASGLPAGPFELPIDPR
jgi:sialate O-acetylesterase